MFSKFFPYFMMFLNVACAAVLAKHQSWFLALLNLVCAFFWWTTSDNAQKADIDE